MSAGLTFPPGFAMILLTAFSLTGSEVGMAKIDDGVDNEVDVEDLVLQHSSCRWDNEGVLEDTRESLKNVRMILARLIDKLADKGTFANDELMVIIRGY